MRKLIMVLGMVFGTDNMQDYVVSLAFDED